MTEAAPRLNADDYRTLTEDLLIQLSDIYDAQSWHYTRDRLVRGGFSTIVDDFPHTPGGHRLRLKLQYPRDGGIVATLCRGDGDINLNQGILGRWGIFDSPISTQPTLHVSAVRYALMDGESVGSLGMEHPLRFEHPLVEERPDACSTAPLLIDDLFRSIKYWRERPLN